MTNPPPAWQADNEDLPDLDGLTPVRSLDDLRRTAASLPPTNRVAEGPRLDAPAPAPPALGPLDPRSALQRYWGYRSFRLYQEEAIAASLAGQDSLVVLATGGGKSLCYQVPAACDRGLAVVISPLIALMDDQVAAAREAGLRAGALHSNLAEVEKRRVGVELIAGRLQLLYISPERLMLGDLTSHLRRLALLAVDEAHCVSHWGHDFRPEYRQLAAAFERLPDCPRMALTATATRLVQDDIVTQLGLRSPRRFVGPVDRSNLIYRVFPRAKALEQILEVVARHPGEGGIVYAQTRAEVERLSQRLREHGVDASAYHAGLAAAERARVQRDFVNERLAVVVATIAFGMGIDRSNVRFVVHANCPRSIEHYQQEAGRAGRDGEPAECVLLSSYSDIVTWRHLALKSGPLPPERQKALERQLKEIGRYTNAPVCRHRLLVEHFGQAYAPVSAQGCGACDVCLGQTSELPAAEALVTAQKILSAVWRTGGSFGTGHIVDVLRGRDTDLVRRRRHDQLTVYGLLAEANEAGVRAWIDQLVVQGHLEVVDHDGYPLLTMTEPGRDLCRGQGQVRLGQLAVLPKRKRERKATGAAAQFTGSQAADQTAVFERLRRWRKAASERNGVAPYIIAHDATLAAFATARPATLEALAEIKGMGEYKIRRYGREILAVLAGVDPERPLAETPGISEAAPPSIPQSTPGEDDPY